MANFEIFPKPIEPDRTTSEKAPNRKRRSLIRARREYLLGYQLVRWRYRFWPTQCTTEPA
jgi:hypothetical protein